MKAKCPHCGKEYDVPEAAIGRKSQCSDCSEMFEVKASETTEKDKLGPEEILGTLSWLFFIIGGGMSVLVCGTYHEFGLVVGVVMLGAIAVGHYYILTIIKMCNSLSAIKDKLEAEKAK